MRQYINWGERSVNSNSEDEVTASYNEGYVFVRIAKDKMQKTRSLRINLKGFELNSENRRVLSKIQEMELRFHKLPIKEENYSWQIHKLGKEFYDTKSGKGVFTAAKIKELVTDADKSSFNILMHFEKDLESVGYCIGYENKDLLHYAYPFYNLTKFSNNFGMGMMLNAINWAKIQGKDFIYLGSVVEAKDRYKLQFNNLEWFDGQNWQTDLEELKKIITVNN